MNWDLEAADVVIVDDVETEKRANTSWDVVDQESSVVAEKTTFDSGDNAEVAEDQNAMMDEEYDEEAAAVAMSVGEHGHRNQPSSVSVYSYSSYQKCYY